MSGSRQFRFSTAQLLLAATSISLLVGSFVAFGPLGGSATVFTIGSYLYLVGRKTHREWMESIGFWSAAITGTVLATFLVAYVRQFRFVLSGWMEMFLGHPMSILVTSGVIFAAFVYLRLLGVEKNRPLVLAGIAWLLYAPWEYYCTVHKYDIRVDLLWIGPLLLILTSWGVLSSTNGIVQLWIDTQPKPSRD